MTDRDDYLQELDNYHYQRRVPEISRLLKAMDEKIRVIPIIVPIAEEGVEDALRKKLKNLGEEMIFAAKMPASGADVSTAMAEVYESAKEVGISRVDVAMLFHAVGNAVTQALNTRPVPRGLGA